MFEEMDKEDLRFAAMFKGVKTHIADDGFSEAVTREIRRRVWTRRLVLFAAASMGLVLALGSMQEIILALSRELIGLAARWDTAPAVVDQSLLNLIPARDLLQALGDKLMVVADNWNHPAALTQYPLFAAGLLALVSPFAIRMLER